VGAAASEREPAFSLEQILGRADDIAIDIAGLQDAISAYDERGRIEGAGRLLAYRRLVRGVRAAVRETVPAGATVLVVSNGDDELVQFEAAEGWHFPRDAAGTYLGYHPPDGAAAVRHLERLRTQGAQYLLFPKSAFWWLDYYRELAQHIDEHYSVVARGESALIVSLAASTGADTQAELALVTET
jgi:hypothetical protein